MKDKIILGILGITPAIISCGKQQIQQQIGQKQPNVVIFFTDDQGYADVNRYGGIDLKTPNMDKLCDEGVRFTQFYANSSISSPSRASLMTGRYPQRAGMPDLAPSQSGKEGMPASEFTIAEALKSAGYATALIGKWHLGYSPETMPNNQGFDYAFGHMGGCIDNYSHYFYWNGPNRHDLWQNGEEIYLEGENFSDLMIEKSKRFIEDNKDKPFFLYFSSNYPHYPLQGDKKWCEYYKDLPSPRDKYAAMVSTIDEKIGMVIDKLEKEGLKDNTIIIFMSDNGYSTEERGFNGGGSAGNLRGSKFSCFEGGIRVPAIISYPKHLPKNEIRNQVAMGADWFPTILDLCGVPLPASVLDGKSLVKIIQSADEKSPHEVINWEVGKCWAIRKGNYKLVYNIDKFTSEKVFGLYDINKDEAEQHDISIANPQIVADLQMERSCWLQNISSK